MLLGVALVLLAPQSADVVSEAHRVWLEEEVAVLITEGERELFSELSSDADRALFIEAFWDRRDPDRATPDNERRDEHYRRIAEADRRFREGSSRRGATTERGRYYLLLGEPNSFEPFIGRNEVVTSELWFYRGGGLVGLSPRFNLLFFMENNTGPYRLYSPLDDGPEALLAVVGFAQDRARTIDTLRGVSVDLARASLTIDLTDPVGDVMARPRDPNATADPSISFALRPSTSAHVIVAAILESAKQGIDTDYVDGYRRHQSRVESEYSFGYVSNRPYWTVLYDASGAAFLHFSLDIDAEDVTFRPVGDGSAHASKMRIDIEVESRASGRVAVPSRDVEIRLDSDQMAQALVHAFSYQDSFPLVPGAYKVVVTLRDLAGERFTIAERNVSVAPLGGSPELGGVALGFRTSVDATPGSFGVTGVQISPAGAARFSARETLHALVQVRGSQGTRLTTRLSGPEGVVRELTRSVGTEAVVEELELAALPEASYSLSFELSDGAGAVLATRVAAFDVAHEELSVPRPALTYRNVVGEPSPEATTTALVQQYIALGQIDGAERALRSLFERSDSPPDWARWQLASLVLFSGRSDEALLLLEPIAEAYPDRIEVVEGLGFAYYLEKEYGRALERFELAMAMRPPDTSLLNAAADCHQQLGGVDQARELFELSLSVDPSQEGVRARLLELSPP